MASLAEREAREAVETYRKARSVVTRQYVWNVVDGALENLFEGK